MKERGILFNALMVRATLDGSKTKMRRICKPMNSWVDQDCREVRSVDGAPHHFLKGAEQPMERLRCPHGQPGDRLYVREAHYLTDNGESEFAVYAADDEAVRTHISAINALPRYFPEGVKARHRKLRPSIHMPRWASRITLEIVSVRVERLQDISESDARAEGVMQLDAEDFERPMEREKDGWKLCPRCYGTGLHNGLGAGGGVIYDIDCRDCDTHAKLYRHLWESINGPGSWDANPWVWVVEFKRILSEEEK